MQTMDAARVEAAVASQVRMWIVDGCPAVRDAVRLLMPKTWKCFAAPGLGDLLERDCGRAVVLVDPQHLDRRNGAQELEVALAVLASRGSLPVIYSFEQRPVVLARCLAAGAVAVISKAAEPAALVASVHEIARTGRQRHCPVSATDRGPRLSQRQIEVLSARARGESFPSIGARLGIASKTAAEYLAAVSAKFPGYLASHSAADLERELGLAPGDVFDWR